MAQLQYSRDEIMADHAYARPQVEAGYTLHGGFDSAGTYISPRTLHRWPAVRAWGQALKARGWPLIDADVTLMSRGNYPSLAQQKFLLVHDVGQSLWDSITITGVIEARGRLLCDFVAPDFQQIVDEDISQMAVGHLNKGLLFAHGLDEGGDPDNGVGAHDAMWFAVRDLLFGKDTYPLPNVPESIARPVEGREMPLIPEEYEQVLVLLMNVLMIEVRAENFFSFCYGVAQDPDAFTDRPAEALKAAELVNRIRTDEAIHVAYLQAVVSELRSLTFKTDDGQRVPGKDVIDPVWDRMVQWHTQINHDNARAQTRDKIQRLLSARPDGSSLMAQFDSLETKLAA